MTEVKDAYAIHIIIYYIDGGEMEREGQKGREGEYGRVEDTGGGKLLLSGKTIISHPEVYRTVVSINIETSFSDCQLSGLHTGVYESIQFMAVLFSLPPYVRRELSLQICVAV